MEEGSSTDSLLQKEFDWSDTEKQLSFFEMTAKYGNVFFQLYQQRYAAERYPQHLQSLLRNRKKRAVIFGWIRF